MRKATVESMQDLGYGLNCSCSADYTGIGCQYEYDACAEGACQNGATCIDKGKGYKCICPDGYEEKKTVKLTSMTASLASVHQHQVVSILPTISIAVVNST